MNGSLTDALCTTCGLCCDGSLFADVELAGQREATQLEVMGLEIEEDENDGGLLAQPCAALQRRRCAIYAHRPKCCRTFECRLLQDARRGMITVPRAKDCIAATIKRVGKVRELIRQMGHCGEPRPLKERCAEALGFADETRGNPTLDRKRTELETAMKAVEELVQRWFLDDRTGRPT